MGEVKLLYSEVISWEKDLRGMICWTDKKNLEEKLMARQALICLLHSNSVIATINSEGGSSNKTYSHSIHGHNA